MAEASLFIVLARIVWGLDFHSESPSLPDMNDDSETGTWTDGFVSLPRPFGVAFAPRAGREEIMKLAYDDAQREWEIMGLPVDVRRGS